MRTIAGLRGSLPVCLFMAVGGSLGAQGQGDTTAHLADSLSAAAFDSLVERPSLISCPRPIYPPQLRREEMQGLVLVAFTVDTLGAVEEGSVRVEATSNGALVNSAMAAALGCKFRPARISGKAVRLRLRLPFNFVAGADTATSRPDTVTVEGVDTTILARDVERPELLSAPGVLYPEELRRKGIKGSVLVAFVLDTLGRPERSTVRVLSASDPGFIDAALDVVLGSRYRPARLKVTPGRAIRVKINQPVHFSFRGRPR